MNIAKKFIPWILIITAIVWLFPKTANLKFSNLDYRRSTGATRQAVDASQAPWSAVGRLLLPNGICSALLVAPNVIVTARHCFMKKTALSTKHVAATDVSFQLERNGKLESVSTLATVSYPDVSFFTSSQTSQQHDYAFATLSKPVDIKKFSIALPMIAAASPPLKQPLTQAGYGANHEKIYGDDCAVIGIKNSIIQHNCLITFGDSGGPIFYKQNGQWFFVGINSYYESINRLVEHAFAIGPENYYRPLQDFMR